MKTHRYAIMTLMLLPALAGLSCQEPQTVKITDMVEPMVTEVDVLGGTCGLNVGFMDDIHMGQTLYVTRNNKAVAYLVVQDLKEYEAECRYTKLRGQLIGPMTDDPVVRRLGDVSRPRTLRDRVPRYVRVPYDPDNTVVKVGERRVRIRERLISREKYDEWKKKWEAEKVGANPE